MASEYLLLPKTFPDAMQIVLRVATGEYIPFDPGNKDYQEYLAWCAEGNVADVKEP
jgi:hypothetical protein